MEEIVEIKGFQVRIMQDVSPANPFEEFDCEPPLMVFYKHCLKEYGDVPSVRELVAMIPDREFGRGARVGLLKRFNIDLAEFADFRKREGYAVKAAFMEWVYDLMSAPSYWSEAKEYFSAYEDLCREAGIVCHYTTVYGYSQGSETLTLAVATPAWVELTGAPPEHQEEQMQNACKLYGYWAFGDVYGIAEILDPEGDEVADGSVWGFYGPFKESGILEAAEETIDYEIKQREIRRIVEREETRRQAEWERQELEASLRRTEIRWRWRGAVLLSWFVVGLFGLAIAVSAGARGSVECWLAMPVVWASMFWCFNLKFCWKE